MSRRKYEVIVHRDVYCTSAPNYIGRVTIKGPGPDTREYDLHNGTIFAHNGLREKRYPAYVRHAIKQQFKELLVAGLRVYECDRDGNERRDDYRYHRHEYLEALIRGL